MTVGARAQDSVAEAAGEIAERLVFERLRAALPPAYRPYPNVNWLGRSANHGLSTPERVTLYFTESAQRLSMTRTDEQLDQARADVLARVVPTRDGDLTATPGRPRRYSAFGTMAISPVRV
ncbi:MAG: hypothetical protein HYX57_05070 [Chloroflexi bacterium]|nr:hypothetical protein [Chloroflexota bacterium]